MYFHLKSLKTRHLFVKKNQCFSRHHDSINSYTYQLLCCKIIFYSIKRKKASWKLWIKSSRCFALAIVCLYQRFVILSVNLGTQGPGNCTLCKHVTIRGQDNSTTCLNQCPEMFFANENNICLPCSDKCAEGYVK